MSPHDNSRRYRWRLPLLVATLAIIVYYTVFISVFVPYFGFVASWQPDGVWSVTEIPPGREAAAYLKPGDRIVAIDNVPVRPRLWRPIFTPGKTSYEYTVARGEEQYRFTIPVEEATWEMKVEVATNRSTTGLVALAFWVVGALIIFFATPQNADARLLGLVTLSTAVVLAASEGALYNAPGGWLLSNLAIPFLAVFLFRLAFLPRQQPFSPRTERVFRFLFLAATVLATLAAFELFFLFPRDSSFEILTGISLYGILLLALAVGMLANLIVLLWRFARMPPSYTRQQILILVIFTALAIVPGQILTFYPWLLFESPILSWALASLMLAFIPAGYGYVIYRRRYLQLDIFMTNSLTMFVIVALFAVGYSAIAQLIGQNRLVERGSLLPGLIVMPLMLLVPYASRPTRRAVQAVLFGPHQVRREKLTDFSARLAAQPNIANLRAIFRETLTLLQVRQAALLLADNANTLVPIDEIRVSGVQPITIQKLKLPIGAHPYLAYDVDLPAIDSGLAALPWLEAVVPLVARGQWVGMLLLGRPVPDGYFNANDLLFLRQLADTMAVAALTVQLFESSRTMSGKLLQVRDAERLHLASQIHDQPLQRVSFVAGELERLSQETGGELAERMRRHSQELTEVTANLRGLCAGLYPPLRQQGLQWAVRDAVHEVGKRESFKIALNVDLPVNVVVAEEVASSTYHILREALNNVAKHARATRVWVRLYQSEENLCLLVEDNGECNEATFLPVPDLLRRHHYGLTGMHEWAHTVNGTLTISQRPEGGTSVRLTVPPPWREA